MSVLDFRVKVKRNKIQQIKRGMKPGVFSIRPSVNKNTASNPGAWRSALEGACRGADVRKASGQLVDPDGPLYKSRGAGAGSHSLGSAHPEAPSSSADRRRRGTRESMSLRGAVTGCLALVCLVALLAERAEAHITFFSPKEMMVLKEQEGKKFMEPRSEDEQFEEIPVQQLSQDKMDKTLEIAVRLSPKQLDHAVPVLEELIQEMVEERQKAK